MAFIISTTKIGQNNDTTCHGKKRKSSLLSFLNDIVADELQGCLITCIKKTALEFLSKYNVLGYGLN